MLVSFFIRGFRGMTESRFGMTQKTALIGPNGSGKTHILEGIHLASGGSSTYIQAPRKEDAFFEIGYEDMIGTKIFSLTRSDEKDIYGIQGKKTSGIKYREGLPYRSVFISPFDMNLLYFAPGVRRDYIDSILGRTYAQFSKVKREYELTMRQRNALLKKIREGEAKGSDLDYWDMSFIQKAQTYHIYRMQWKNFLEKNTEMFHAILPEYKIRFHYSSKIESLKKETGNSYEEVMTTYLRENRERDILTGHTHIGPHLDDFGFFIESENTTSIETSLYLSRGENKVLLFTLKQIEILFLKKSLSLPIILLFDDIFSELDSHRAKSVIQNFDADQIIISAPRALPKSENWDSFSCINLDPV